MIRMLLFLASCIFRMLEHIITNVGFKCGLKSYLNNGKIKYNGISEPRTLFEAFETQTCFTPSLPPMITLTEMLETWTNNIGFPLITVKRNTATNIISFHQSTYKSPRAPEILPDQTWIVPITYITRSDTDYKTSQPLWSIGKKPVKSLKAISPSDWVLCNYLQAGYYRVMYEPQNWELLIKQLLENHDKIPVINRAQLLDDAFALAYDDKLNYIIPFKLAKYLEKETEILPWLSATFHLDLLYSELKQTKDMGIIKNYIKNLITKLYSVHGFNIKSDATHLFKVGYPVILSLACKIGMEKCVKDAIGEFIAHNADLNNVQADLKGVVFCTACEHAPRPKDVWNTLWELYRNTESSYLKTLILSKLTCTNNDELLETILSKLFDQNDEDIRNSDKSFIINTFFKSPSGVTAFINFLQKKLPVTKFDERSFSILHSMMRNLGSKIENEEQLKQLKYLGYKMEQMKESEYENVKIFIRNSFDRGTKNLEKNSIRMRLIAFALQ